MSKGGAKTTTTQTNGLTGASAGMQGDIYNQAKDAAGNYTTVGPNAATTDALANYQGAMGAGRNGLAALGGDSSQMAKLMNPYQQQVIDASNKQFGLDQRAVSNNINDEATRAGAFGGGRHGVAEGVAQGALANGHEAQIASLLQSGYGNAQGVAGQLANLGMGATGASAGIGDYLRNIQQDQANPGVAKLGLLNSGMAGGGPASSTSSSTTQLPGTSALQNITGLLAWGKGMMSPGSSPGAFNPNLPNGGFNPNAMPGGQWGSAFPNGLPPGLLGGFG